MINLYKTDLHHIEKDDVSEHSSSSDPVSIVSSSILNENQLDELNDIQTTSLLNLLSREGELFEENGKMVETRPLRGSTLYIAKCNIDTIFGIFYTYIFQDIINKHYIMALTYGKIVNQREPLHIRLHSSCVTSETLRGCDCDCVQQLEGALKIISEKKRGILFYLLQEGRGAGYIGKSRDRMLVQASYDKITTFEAYHLMGLKKDHRHYENIPQVCHLLGIGDAEFIVLTNNPDKIEALKTSGINVIRDEPLEFEPSAFNAAYLSSKQASGHLLRYPNHSLLPRSTTPEPVIPFKPLVLSDSQRFIYCSSYYLPMKPINNEIILSEQQFKDMFQHNSIDYYMNMASPFIEKYQSLRHHRIMIKIDFNNLKIYETKHPNDSVCELLTTPYWFKIHVYYDIVTTQEFVILTYGTVTMFDYPIVRLQMESLFNRFPLRHLTYRNHLKKSVQTIVQYGCGILILLSDDGRGAGFGTYAIDRMLLENGLVSNSDEARKKINVNHDANDYNAATILLKNHCPNMNIQMIMNSPTSIINKIEYLKALKKHSFEIKKWIFIQEELF